MTIKMHEAGRAIVKQELTDSSDESVSSNEEECKVSIGKQERIKKESVTEDEDLEELDSNDNDKGDEDEEVEKDSQEDIELGDNDHEEEADGEDEGSDDEDNSETEFDDDGDVNAGWADSIAKILKTNKPKKKKTLVLSKAKKINDPKKVKPKTAGFQVKTNNGEVAEAEIVAEEPKKEVLEGPPRKKKKDILSVRIKPNILEKDRERLLSKIATKGVVQLFNAVKNQQKDIETKLNQAGSLEVKRDKVLKSIDKRSFLDHLMGDNAKSVAVSKELPQRPTKDDSDKTTWNVLRDDFMMGSNKMKDWDKQLDEDEVEEQMEMEQELESD